jgi:uncharacterized protein (TIGR03437 family)
LGEQNHVKTIRAIVLTLGLFAAVAYAQPVVGGVTNAASYSLSPLPNSSIAQGSFFAIFGTGLGPTAAAFWNPYPLPTTLGDASVKVAVGSFSGQAFLYFASSGQINAIMPSAAPTGSGTITVTNSGQSSAAWPITVVGSSFGAFALNQAGSGPAIVTDAGYNLNNLTHTATPGQPMILWGTGLGPLPDPSTEGTVPPCPSGCDLRGSNLSVTVWVGTQQATVSYAGRAPNYSGEDEIVFTVPETSAAQDVQGCYVQIAVQTGPPGGAQVVSNFTSLSVDANGATCSDPDGVNIADISGVLSTKGSANVAAISLLSNFLNLTVGGVLNLQWDNDSVNANIGTFKQNVLNESQGFTLSPSANNCTVSAFRGYPPPSDPALALETYLDAGSALSAKDPGGVTQPVDKNASGNGYGGLVGGSTIQNLLMGGGSPPFYLNSSNAISAGTYTVTAPGGTAVGAFSASIDVSSGAAAFAWTNQKTVATSAIDRTQPLTITWTGGDPNGFVDITAIGSTATSSAGPQAGVTPGTLIECLVPASAGTFTIPPFVLSALPSTQGSQSIVPPGELLVGPASGATKVSPTPSGLDAAYIFYHFIQGVNVGWK